MDWVTLRSRGKELVRKYRYVLLVVLAGLFLMALPDGKKNPGRICKPGWKKFSARYRARAGCGCF